MIFLYILEMLGLHMPGVDPPFDNFYFTLLIGFIISVTMIVTLRKYYKNKPAKARSL